MAIHLTIENVQVLREYITALKSNKEFIEYLTHTDRGLYNLMELYNLFTKNKDQDITHMWSIINRKRYDSVIEFVKRYSYLMADPETRMEQIRKEYPHLLERCDSVTYKLYEKALIGKLDVEDVIEHLKHTTDEKQCFNLYNVTEYWNPYEVLDMYYNGNIGIDYIKQCFYWNATIQSIQTINYIDNDREIETISGDHPDLEKLLDIYHAVYMSYDAPPKTYGLKVLIVESLKGSPIDEIIRYIKTNGIVSITTLRTVYKDSYPTIGINAIIRQLNDRCKDITYNNKDIHNVTSLELGDLLRCSLKGIRNSITTCYMIYEGQLTDKIRIPKQLYKYI